MGEQKAEDKVQEGGAEQAEAKGRKEKKEVKKEKKEEEPPEIVLRVEMHCEGCARKVAKSLRGFEGVEEINIDCKGKKVVVKGKAADPVKVCERVQKKAGKKAEIVSPVPKPPDEGKEEVKEPPVAPEEKKEEQPKPITVILKVRMHCEACSQALQKRIKKMEGVESVETDLSKDQVIVKGFVDPEKLVENVQRRTRKQASVVPEEEKKEEEEKKVEEEKKEEEKPSEEEKKDAKEEEEEEEDDNKKLDVSNKMEYWGPKYSMGYTYDYSPELFSDENPNACTLM
ncbi:Heavy metal-associated isoprenylated plant protein 26 [Apostasia shenzhenica]|uniref:Heavy metal-associated isoprenylated plant protein 26 n=1 Tax=Apostasia shenzhenica TaxID=1088818 RepID=A0A2I0A2G1_9ASPA|nr:Heavy metal-associated isoprenylated plant protein 26 [Apostasia shenzhenica]